VNTSIVFHALRRWMAPRAHLRRWRNAIHDRWRFLRDLHAYSALEGAEPVSSADLLPRFGDWTETTRLDSHYFHLGIWAARRILERRPDRHVDVGSDVNFVGIMTAVTEVEFVDIRPLVVDLPRLRSRAGSVLALPYPSKTIASLSCLHVAEHVGLGRYGDNLDPAGTRKAARELSRVLAPGGTLLFALPVGRERLCFNAHRVHAPATIVNYFDDLELAEFSVVDDSGVLREYVPPDDFAEAHYACGLFRFHRPPAR
jgi:SAM-dependent methyltransferase